MTISIKSQEAIECMRMAGRAASAAREAAGAAVAAGVTTADIDTVVRDTLKQYEAEPSFLNYHGYPAAVCVSLNEEVIHGIPSKKRVIHDGDLVKIDVGAKLHGYQGDTAATFYAGKISEAAQKLIDVTMQSFFEALKVCVAGKRISDISRAVQTYAEGNGFSVVRAFTGHGIGTEMHEDPSVPNYVERHESGEYSNPRLVPGMTIAIEPMINAGTWAVKILSDKWTVVTIDKKLSAHYEHTVLITNGEPELLTK